MKAFRITSKDQYVQDINLNRGTYTFHAEEINVLVIEEAKRRQEQALLDYQKKQVLESIQAFEDAEAINNKDMFPLWEQGLQVKVGEKYQHFNADNEIVLYKVVKENTTKYNDLQPKDNTELFIELPSKEKLTKY